jgi:hypothetical protein
VRKGDAVQGSYLRGEICGSVSGKMTGNRLEFSWNWAGNSGHGIASQTADRLSGTSGFGEDAKGAGTFVLIQRPTGSPPGAWPTRGINETAALNQQVIAQRVLTIYEMAIGPDPRNRSVLRNVARELSEADGIEFTRNNSDEVTGLRRATVRRYCRHARAR